MQVATRSDTPARKASVPCRSMSDSTTRTTTFIRTGNGHRRCKILPLKGQIDVPAIPEPERSAVCRGCNSAVQRSTEYKVGSIYLVDKVADRIKIVGDIRSQHEVATTDLEQFVVGPMFMKMRN